jgi:acyl-CoA synthetase (AMP-forming)/AMP-acid ligase II
VKKQSPETLPELLINAARDYPEQGVGFIRHDRTVGFMTYPVLLSRAREILSGIQQLGIGRGETVILSLDTAEEIVPVLWACFLGGVVPALLQPPVSFSEYNPAAEKAGKVLEVLDNPKVILSHTHFGAWRSSGIPETKLIDISMIPAPDRIHCIPDADPGDKVLIQFSSGSTGDPKGIILTHRNILVNVADIIQGIELKNSDISVNWMPLYHDMGLFGFQITPVFVGMTHYLINPVDFVKNPFLWLDFLSEKKCTITASPNFGQMLVNRYFARKASKKWDISSIRVLFNGAEPISVPVMEEFLECLKPFGLRPEAMFPAYGMAEATLAVTFGPLMRGAEVVSFLREPLLKQGHAVPAGSSGPGTMDLVNLGKPIGNTELRITDENGQAVGNETIGEIRVKGDNVSAGYLNNPEETGRSFRREWLCTGDLGFIRNGNLFVTGRIKDIIFINGTNYYAHDLENTIIRMEGIPEGRIVMAGCFDENDGKDRVIVFLVGSDTPSLRETFVRIKEFFRKKTGLTVETFVPVRSADIPRTSSGKIQRYKLVERFLSGTFPAVLKL